MRELALVSTPPPSQMPTALATHQRPQPPHQRDEMRSGEHLPDVGDERRKDHDRRGLRRRHEQRQQADRDARQTEPDDALDQSGQQKREDRQRDDVERTRHRQRIHRAILLAIRRAAMRDARSLAAHARTLPSSRVDAKSYELRERISTMRIEKARPRAGLSQTLPAGCRCDRQP